MCRAIRKIISMTIERKSILIIDDNRLNLKLCRTILTSAGYSVIEAENAEDGLSLIRAERPDLILMDIQLPGMDGLAATRIIKSDPAIKDIPVIAITSYAMQDDDKKAKEAGCNDYITKPIDQKGFLKMISQYLPVS